VPGQPLVRQFQLAPVAVLGAAAPVRPRDKSGLLAYFHAQWRAAVRHDERIQSANILQREAPSMPTTFSSEHFETARVVSERPTFVDPIIDLAHAYMQAPLEDDTLHRLEVPPGHREEIPVGTRVFGAYQPYRPTAAFLGVIGLLLALVYALISAIESATTQWARAILRAAWDMIPTLFLGVMGGSVTVVLMVLALAGRAEGMQLASRRTGLSFVSRQPRVIEKVHAITSEFIYSGLDTKLHRPNGLHLEPGLIEGEGKLFWTIDSGATAVCIPVEDEWMLDRVTDAHPNIGVEAADGVQLSVKTVGVINADGILPGKIGVETYEIKNNRWVKNEILSYPTMSRVLVTQGLKLDPVLCFEGGLPKHENTKHRPVVPAQNTKTQNTGPCGPPKTRKHGNTKLRACCDCV
jgi:hypothetical protein